MYETVKEIIYDVTGEEGLTMDTDFVRDLSLNSFDIMTLICAFEDKFDISIPTRDVWELTRVSDIVAYLEKKSGQF